MQEDMSRGKPLGNWPDRPDPRKSFYNAPALVACTFQPIA